MVRCCRKTSGIAIPCSTTPKWSVSPFLSIAIHSSLIDCMVLQELLGQGAFGAVYKIQDKKTKVLYAMKEISNNILLPAVQTERSHDCRRTKNRPRNPPTRNGGRAGCGPRILGEARANSHVSSNIAMCVDSCLWKPVTSTRIFCLPSFQSCEDLPIPQMMSQT